MTSLARRRGIGGLRGQFQPPRMMPQQGMPQLVGSFNQAQGPQQMVDPRQAFHQQQQQQHLAQLQMEQAMPRSDVMARMQQLSSAPVQQQLAMSLPNQPRQMIERAQIQPMSRPYGGGPGFAKPLSPNPGTPQQAGGGAGGGPPTKWTMEIKPAANGGMIPGYALGGEAQSYADTPDQAGVMAKRARDLGWEGYNPQISRSENNNAAIAWLRENHPSGLQRLFSGIGAGLKGMSRWRDEPGIREDPDAFYAERPSLDDPRIDVAEEIRDQIPTTSQATPPGASPEERDLLRLAASHASPDNNVDELIEMRRAGMRGDPAGLTEAQFRQGMNSILYGPSMGAASDARYEAVMEPRREALQEPSPADSPVPIYDPTFDEGAAEYAPSPVRTYDPTFDEGAATREVEEALEEAAPETYLHYMRSQHPGASPRWEESEVKEWQIADAKSVAEALANIREPEEPRIEEVIDEVIAEERVPGSAPGYRPGGGGLGSGLSREDLAVALIEDEEGLRDFIDDRYGMAFGAHGMSPHAGKWGYGRRFGSMRDSFGPTGRYNPDRERIGIGRSDGGPIGLAGGGYVPMIYANGGYIPGYGIGGFFKGLGKAVLKAAPIAAMVIPGIGPVAAGAIGGLSGLLSKKLGVDQESWGDVLKGRTVKKRKVGWGDAAKAGLLKGIMSGVGNKAFSGVRGSMQASADAGGGVLQQLQSAGNMLKDMAPSAQTIAKYTPFVGELAKQVEASGDETGGYGGYVQHAQLPGPDIMPQSAGVGGGGGTGQAQGYAQQVLPQSALPPRRAMGGTIPGYQWGGEMVGDEPMGGYIPQQPMPQPVAQQIQPFVPRTQLPVPPQISPIAKLPKAIQKKINTGKKLTKKENQRIRKLPKEDQQIVKNTVARQKSIVATDHRGVPVKGGVSQPPGGSEELDVISQIAPAVPQTAAMTPPPAQAGVPQAQVDPSMVPNVEDLQLDPQMTPPPPTDRGGGSRPPPAPPGLGEEEIFGYPADRGPDIDRPTAGPPGLPPGGYVGPGGQGGGDIGEGELDMGGGLPGGYVPPGGGGSEGGPDMSGVMEALPATGYNPLTGQGYVGPGGIPQEPEQLPQGAGLTDTSGGNEPTLWARNQFIRANPGKTSPSNKDIFDWMQATGTPNTEGGYDKEPEFEDTSMTGGDPNQQFGGGLPGDPGGEDEDSGDEGDLIGSEDHRNRPGGSLGPTRVQPPTQQPPTQQPPTQQPPWQPPQQPLPQSATGPLPPITQGASTVSTPEGYRPGLMAEGQMSKIIGHDPFNMPTSGFGAEGDAFLERMKGPKPQSKARGGPVSAEISSEGYIPPDAPGSAVVENGMGRIVQGDLNTPNTTGAADDRVAFQKVEPEEIDAETVKMKEVLKAALQNPEEIGSQQAIHTAIAVFGEDFVAKIIEEIEQESSLALRGPIAEQDKLDNLIEMDTRRRLAQGEPLKAGALVQGGEFVFTKKAVENAGGPDVLDKMMTELEQRNA